MNVLWVLDAARQVIPVSQPRLLYLFTMDNTESRKRPASEMNDRNDNSNKRPYIPEKRETTIFGVKPVDDIVQYVADFIATHCDQDNVEVSAH